MLKPSVLAQVRVRVLDAEKLGRNNSLAHQLFPLVAGVYEKRVSTGLGVAYNRNLLQER